MKKYANKILIVMIVIVVICMVVVLYEGINSVLSVM